MMAKHIRCTFRPQAWQHDYAVDVDPEGPTTWIMNAPIPLPKPHSYDSDTLRDDPAAPQWCREWSGPFEVEFEDIILSSEGHR